MSTVLQIVAVDELGLGVKKPKTPVFGATPKRRAGVTGAMTPLSRTFVASTPQVSAPKERAGPHLHCSAQSKQTRKQI